MVNRKRILGVSGYGVGGVRVGRVNSYTLYNEFMIIINIQK